MPVREIYKCKKIPRPPRPERFFNWLKLESFPRELEGAGYEVSEENRTEVEKVAEFWADCQFHLMKPSDMERINQKGWEIPVLEYPWPEKGLFICGACGRGKTALTKIIHSLMTSARNGSSRFESAISIVNDYLENGETELSYRKNSFQNSLYVIDDFGSEREAKRFGADPVMHDLVCYRSEQWEMRRTPTIFTSNLMPFSEKKDVPDDITACYGDRIKSRIMGMCDVVILTGEDRRRETPPEITDCGS